MNKKMETGTFSILVAFSAMLGAAIVSNTPELQAQKSDAENVVFVRTRRTVRAGGVRARFLVRVQEFHLGVSPP
jgi:hypothetical protein